jgi:hypothetical protein
LSLAENVIRFGFAGRLFYSILRSSIRRAADDPFRGSSEAQDIELLAVDRKGFNGLEKAAIESDDSNVPHQHDDGTISQNKMLFAGA